MFRRHLLNVKLLLLQAVGQAIDVISLEKRFLKNSRSFSVRDISNEYLRKIDRKTPAEKSTILGK